MRACIMRQRKDTPEMRKRGALSRYVGSPPSSPLLAMPSRSSRSRIACSSIRAALALRIRLVYSTRETNVTTTAIRVQSTLQRRGEERGAH